jgi:hypothetical protein
MNNWIKVKQTFLTILLTLNVALLIGILIESYTKNSWDTLKILATIVIAINIIRLTIEKYSQIKPDAPLQTPDQTPDTK